MSAAHAWYLARQHRVVRFHTDDVIAFAPAFFELLELPLAFLSAADLDSFTFNTTSYDLTISATSLHFSAYSPNLVCTCGAERRRGDVGHRGAWFKMAMRVGTSAC